MPVEIFTTATAAPITARLLWKKTARQTTIVNRTRLRIDIAIGMA
jgi:hypothetical protein